MFLTQQTCNPPMIRFLLLELLMRDSVSTIFEVITSWVAKSGASGQLPSNSKVSSARNRFSVKVDSRCAFLAGWTASTSSAVNEWLVIVWNSGTSGWQVLCRFSPTSLAGEVYTSGNLILSDWRIQQALMHIHKLSSIFYAITRLMRTTPATLSGTPAHKL